MVTGTFGVENTLDEQGGDGSDPCGTARSALVELKRVEGEVDDEEAEVPGFADVFVKRSQLSLV